MAIITPKKPVVKAPVTPKPPAGYIPVRATVEAGGGTVGYDKNLGVSIGGNYLNKNDYTIVGGKAYAKPGAIVSGVRSSVNPAPTFSAPAYQALSIEKAREQARAQLQPAYQEARSNAGVVNQQQLHQLQQAMNARGQLDSGTAIQGEINNSANLQSTLGNIDTSFNTQREQMAEALRQQSLQEYTDAYNRALQQFQTQYQGYRDNVGDQQWQRGFDQQDKLNTFNNNLAWRQDQRAGNESAVNIKVANAGLTGYYTDPKTGKQVPTYQAQQDKVNNSLAAYKAAKSGSGGGGGGGSSYTATNRGQNDYYDGYLAETTNADGEKMFNNLVQNKAQYVQTMGADNYAKALNAAREKYYQTLQDRWRGRYEDGLQRELPRGAFGDPNYYRNVLGMEYFNKLMGLEDK